jgi:hypothetical protein
VGFGQTCVRFVPPLVFMRVSESGIVNNQPVRGLKDLHATLGSRKPGQPLAVQVERQGQLQFVVMEAE